MHNPIRKMGFINLIIQLGAVPQSQSRQFVVEVWAFSDC